MTRMFNTSDRIRNSRSHQRFLWLALMVCASGVMTGCEQKVEGPERFARSGTITYMGNPVPIGELQFSPDTQKGNSGPGAIAKIKDGHYQTYPGKGTVGGPMRIRLTGLDGKPVKVGDEVEEDGTLLFDSFEVEVDLPAESSTWDYDVTRPAPKSSRS